MLILDSHCDSPSQMHRLRNFALDNDHSQVDFPKMKRGGVDASFFALYTSNSLTSEEAEKLAQAMLNDLESQVSSNRDVVSFAGSAEDILRNKADGLMSILVGLENGSPIGEDLDKLDWYYDHYVRYVTLTHNGDNLICDSCGGNHKWGGLSPFGKEVVSRMNKLGMIVDIAHCADDTVRACLEWSKEPIVSTHSCCRALCEHRRNLTDDLLKGIAQKGGVVQINFYPSFLSEEFQKVFDASGLADMDYIEDAFIAHPEDAGCRAAWYDLLDRLAELPRPSYKRVVDHIDHAVSVMGVDHVGIGSDFDGIGVTPEGLEDISKLPVIFEEMRLRGYSETEIEKIAGGNFLRLL